MSDTNGLKVTPLNSDCSRVAVKSSIASSWMLGYKPPGHARPKAQEIAVSKDELLVIAFQDGSGSAEVQIEPLGDRAGTIIMQSSRGPTMVLRVGGKYRRALAPGESLVFRSRRIVYPTNAGAGLSA